MRRKGFLMGTCCVLLCAGFLFLATGRAGADLRSLGKKIGKGVKKAGKTVQETGSKAVDKGEADLIANNAYKELRESEKMMFAGKKKEAIDILLKAAEKINKIKILAPEHKRLKTLESKRDKLKKDLERRTGQKIELPGPPKPPIPDDPPSLVKEIKAEHRNAEKNMHSGKHKQAKKDLDRAMACMKKLKELEPENKEIKLLEPKLNNLNRDLSKRLAKMEQAEKPAQIGKTKTTAPSTEDKKLSHHVRQDLKRIDRTFPRLEGNLEDAANADKDMRKSYLKRAPDKMKEIEDTLAQAKEKAAEDGVTEHPSFDEVETRLAECKKRYEELSREFEKADAAAAETAKGVEGDVNALAGVLEPLKNTIFSKATGTAIYYNDLGPVKECIEAIEKFEKEDLAAAQKALDEFAAKYGNSKEEVDNKMDELGYAGNRQPGFIFRDLKQGIENVAKTRKVMSEDLIRKLDKQIADLPARHDFYRVEMHKTAREWLDMAQRFDKDNPKVKEAGAGIDDKLKTDLEKFYEKIDKKKWPGNSSGKNAKGAMTFFKEDKGWGKNPKEARKPLGVAITGGWSVQKKDILGHPVMYGLPVFVAVQLDSEKDMGLARVFNVTMRTEESANPKKEPPFTSLTVGDSFYIRAKKIK